MKKIFVKGILLIHVLYNRKKISIINTIAARICRDKNTQNWVSKKSQQIARKSSESASKEEKIATRKRTFSRDIMVLRLSKQKRKADHERATEQTLCDSDSTYKPKHTAQWERKVKNIIRLTLFSWKTLNLKWKVISLFLVQFWVEYQRDRILKHVIFSDFLTFFSPIQLAKKKSEENWKRWKMKSSFENVYLKRVDLKWRKISK